MTKTLTKTTLAALAALALGMAAPAMAATDGTPGVTSVGKFDVSLNLNAPPAPVVQVYGIEDIAMGTFELNPTSSTTIPDQNMYFCVSNSAGPNVIITVSQNGHSGAFKLAGPGGDIGIGAGVYYRAVTETPGSFSNGASFTLPTTPSGCSASSGAAEAHNLGFTSFDVQAGTQPGNYTATMTITVAVP
jgi:hypothetical protein